MKTYWDSSAVIAALTGQADALEALDEHGPHVTNSHTLAEVFSTLTGGKLGSRADADDATESLQGFAEKVSMVSLDGMMILQALKQARRRGVRGGAVYDYLHAFTAEQQGAKRIYTYNLADFQHVTKIPVQEP
jgi:predicted nucleic acid-binding protein